MVDLRSDTVTQPCGEMRRAMAEAAVGDDVYGDDPTVAQLEAEAAALLGKEAALFVPSGTMANVVALAAHCARGEEVLCGAESHVYCHEAGAASVLLGVPMFAVPNEEDGSLALGSLEAAVKPDDPHYPRTAAVTVETTQNECGGRPLSLDYMDAVGDLAHDRGLKLHVDGARVMNAVVALQGTGGASEGVTAARYLRSADTVSMCLSKGLGAPVGSVVAGDAAFVAGALRTRKLLGGGMRQVGILAAAGLFALRYNVDRLADDARRATQLAAALDALPGVSAPPPFSNMVYFSVDMEGAGGARVDGDAFAAALAARGVLVGAYGGARVRAVLHKDIDDDGLRAAVDTIQAVHARFAAAH